MDQRDFEVREVIGDLDSTLVNKKEKRRKRLYIASNEDPQRSAMEWMCYSTRTLMYCLEKVRVSEYGFSIVLCDQIKIT